MKRSHVTSSPPSTENSNTWFIVQCLAGIAAAVAAAIALGLAYAPEATIAIQSLSLATTEAPTLYTAATAVVITPTPILAILAPLVIGIGGFALLLYLLSSDTYTPPPRTSAFNVGLRYNNSGPSLLIPVDPFAGYSGTMFGDTGYRRNRNTTTHANARFGTYTPSAPMNNDKTYHQ